MKKYIVTATVKRVHGEQTWLIEANSPKEAEQLVNDGQGEWQGEEIEVTDSEVVKGSAREISDMEDVSGDD